MSRRASERGGSDLCLQPLTVGAPGREQGPRRWSHARPAPGEIPRQRAPQSRGGASAPGAASPSPGASPGGPAGALRSASG